MTPESPARVRRFLLNAGFTTDGVLARGLAGLRGTGPGPDRAEELSHAERLPRGDEVLAFIEGCARTEQLSAPTLLAAPARLADGATITATTHPAGESHVRRPPRLGLAGTVGPGGWRPAITVHPAVLAALLAGGGTPIGERLDAAAQEEGQEPLDVLGPALMGLRELIRMGIVRTD